MEDIKQRSVQGGFAKLSGQAANFVLRIGYLAIMARLLTPADFGLVAMVTVVTGVYDLFTNAGLSMATVQRASVSDAQVSTLFWINVLIGTILALLCVASAPLLVGFYRESRLFWITIAMGGGFIVNAAGVQHYAQLQRQIRYVTIAVLDLATQFAGYVLAIVMAAKGYGYWSLVASSVATPALATACWWFATGWIPGRPDLKSGIGNMLGFGATVTLNGIVVYAAYNLDKVLLGRFLGADVLGLYGRAYQLVNIPISNLNTAVGGVLFSALSRLQNEPERLRSYFINGYSLVISMTVPTALFCGFFADDIVHLVLGPQWDEAVPIFRLLTPTVLVFGIINPTGWLLMAVGLQMRSLKVAFVIAPLVITAYFLGLPYGPKGVAFAYSAAMLLWVVPHVIWCLRGTSIHPMDIIPPIVRAMTAGLAGVLVAVSAMQALPPDLATPIRLAVAGALMGGTYAAVLFQVLGQKEFFVDLLRTLRGRNGLA